jgi:hypothetical protein
MTELANAYAMHKIKLNDSITLLLWSFITSSYPACPSSAYSGIFFTILKDNKIGKSFVLGKEESYGDAPIGYESVYLSKLYKDGKFVINEYDIKADYDTMIAERTNAHWSYLIRHDSVISLGNKRDTDYNVKIKE